jgi:hypothetical protein
MRPGTRNASPKAQTEIPGPSHGDFMRAIKPLLLSLSMLALASGAAYAADDAKNKSAQAKPATPQASSPSSGASGGGASSGASGGASSGASAKYDFDKADKNHDGRLSRAEWDEMMKGSASSGSSSSGSTSAKDTKTPAPSSGKMGDKPATSSSTTSK